MRSHEGGLAGSDSAKGGGDYHWSGTLPEEARPEPGPEPGPEPELEPEPLSHQPVD